MKQFLFVSTLTAASSIPSKLQASLIFPVDPWFSFERDDEPDNWSTDAKLKLKVGVVSVTAKQHREGPLQYSQSMADLQMVKCNVVSALSRDDALECFSVKDAFRQDCRSFGFGSGTSMSLRSKYQIGLCDACVHFGATTESSNIVMHEREDSRLDGA